jgi:hypothetical protein
VTNLFALVIESTVAVLLLLTIGYCLLLNRKLRRLKADEQCLKATISELITATEIAERAIAGLKMTVRDCDQNLGERLRTAEHFSAEIGEQIAAGREIMDKLTQIVAATRPVPAPAPVQMPPAPDTRAVLAAANAFAERARSRVNGRAA